MKKHIAVDLGADSGRVIIGTLGETEEVHRFKNGPVRLGQSIFWDILGLYREIKHGLAAAFESYGPDVTSIGVDAWGVDFGLIDASGDLVTNPYHYRDGRTDGYAEKVLSIIPFEEIYEETGIQMMQINTIYQLYAFTQQKPELVSAVRTFLSIPSLLNYWLTGIKAEEYSLASTTALYNPRKGDWSQRVIDALGFDRSLFPRIVPSGTRLGPLLPEVAREVGAPDSVDVIAVGSHDTASAVAAVPAPDRKEYAYISSGTWSLLGIESAAPIISEESRRFNYTNEGAANGGIRFLKNIMGLWILQESKRAWEAEGGNESYDDLMRLGESSPPSLFELDVDDSRFLKPSLIDDDMPARIVAFCRETGQTVPKGKPGIIRGIYEGLAARYAACVAEIETITGSPIRELFIVGGGSSDSFLSSLTANAAGIPVHAGLKEATALGNILVQSIAIGVVQGYSEGRQIIRDAHQITEYLPG